MSTDPVAEALVPAPYRAILHAAARAPRMTRTLVKGVVAITGGLARHLPFRTRAIDDALSAEIARGTRQVVLLGAGLDARAHRLETLADTVVYEVDFPATQATKRQAARDLPTRARAITYVPVDFAHDDLVRALAAAGHDANATTVFVWEGVLMYLDEEAIDATLTAVARLAAPGSVLVATYYTTDPMPQAVLARPFFAYVGEPLKTRLSPAALASRLARHGFEVESDEGDREWSRRWVGKSVRAVMSERLVVARRTKRS